MAANSLLTPSVITKETLTILQNNLVMAGRVHRKFENQFVKIGTSLTIRKPNRFKVTKGPGLSIQDVTEPSTSITISNQAHVDFQFTGQDLTLAIEEFSERYCKPAAEALASQIDVDVMANYQSVWNEVGTPGVVPASFAALAAVGQRMDEGANPQNDRVLVLNAAAYWSLATNLTTLFVKSVAEAALKGFIANIANFEIYLDQNVAVQTVGAYGGTPVVNGAAQSGSALVTNGWTASVTGLLNVGDVFTIAGVFAVNPQSKVSTQALMNFVVGVAANSDSGGNSTLQISPAIVTSGPYQNVTNAPANLSAITVKGTASTQYAQNIGFCPEAFGLVVVPLEVPGGVDFAAREVVKGISMTIIRAFDVNNYLYPCRIDCLYGTAAYYPELATRLTN